MTIYKVMGMEMKNKAGKWVMPDDPAFEPIYRDISAAHNRALIAHLAEPDSCWQPPNPASPDYSYYKEHPGDKVRAFLLKYQDRVLYATDLVVPRSQTADAVAEFRNTYSRDWKFLSTGENVAYMGHTYRGLALPPPVLRKLFHDNAIRWFPGLIGQSN